jgi:hypothetical protein
MRLYEQSQQLIRQLEEKLNELEHPLKPHLIRLDMQTKQVNNFVYVFSKDRVFFYNIIRHKKNMLELKLSLYKK